MSDVCIKTWVDWLSAALTPIIAIVMTYIAIQQHRLEKIRNKHTLYEKRLAIYKNISKFLGHIMAKGELYDYDVLINYRREISEAYFLFDDELNQYFEKLYLEGLDLITKSVQIKEVSGDEKKNLIKKRSDIVKWFINQNPILRDTIKKYLRIEI